MTGSKFLILLAGAAATASTANARITLSSVEHSISGFGYYDNSPSGRGEYTGASGRFDYRQYFSNNANDSHQDSGRAEGIWNEQLVGFFANDYEFSSTASSSGIELSMNNEYDSSPIFGSDYATTLVTQESVWEFTLDRDAVLEYDVEAGFGTLRQEPRGFDGPNFPFNDVTLLSAGGAIPLALFDASESGTVNLAAGDYTLWVSTVLAFDVNDLGSTLSGSYGQHASFQFIPAPASAITLLGLGIVAHRRR
ncbi:MAG: hypothetical protein AAGG07_00490 [Planctomycetota bacterium]